MKKLMLPFLTEWLLIHGTAPISASHLQLKVDDATWMKAQRLEYISLHPVEDKKMYLTKEGVKYLQENQK
jgi:hypothetical protein